MSRRDYEFRKRAIAGSQKTALDREPHPLAVVNDSVFLDEIHRSETGKRWVGKIRYWKWTYKLTLWPEDMKLLSASTGIDFEGLTHYRFEEPLYLQVRKHHRRYGFQGISFILDADGKQHWAADYK